MKARQTKFKQIDLIRAIRGVKAAGFDPSEVTILPSGAIQLRTGNDNGLGTIDDEFDQWDKAGKLG